MCKEKKPGDMAPKKNEVLRHLSRHGDKWQTWITIDGKPVPGSILVHPSLFAARRWVRDERKH